MNERLQIKQKLKDDFQHYASKCLKIRTKSGSIEPLVLNKAQLYIHSQLQKQLGETGKVRALVLKSRQQGCCYTPEMKVLTADYRWVPLHAIQIGDELIGIDENLSLDKHSAGRRYPRKLRTSIVEAKAELLKPVFKVCLDNGTTIEVTGEHRHLCRKRAATDTQWREINKTKVGDYIRYISPAPSESDDPYEDGWFGGILDGEGTLREKTGLRLSFCPVDNVVLKRAKTYLESKNIKYYENIDTRQPGTSSKFVPKAVHCIAINRFADALEILSKCRPSRFVNKRVYEGHELPGKAIKGGNHCWAKVMSITPIGRKKVIDLQTSTKTYICEGLVSHNSTYIGARFYHKATWYEGMQAFIMAHSLDATNNLYKMAQRFYEYTPESIKIPLVKSNSKELIFDWLHSGYKLGTAENKNVGRSSTIQLLHWCLAEGTPIYDPSDGCVRMIEDFKVGDNILTHNGNIAPISFISSQQKICISIIFRSLASFPLVATKEHQFWTIEGWKQLGELKIGDSIGYPVASITSEIKQFHIPQIIYSSHGGGNKYECPDKIKCNYELGRIIGLYLAEGHIKLQHKAPHRPCNVSFAVHRKETQRTLDWLMPFDDYFSSINVSHSKTSLTTQVTVYGNRFACFINGLCSRVETKHFPLEWRKMGKEFCRGMLHGYISGDGHSDPGDRMIRASSIRSSITIACRDIAASLGYGWGGIKYREGAIRHGGNEKAQYTLNLCGDGAMRLAQEISKPFRKRERAKVISNKEFAAHGVEISHGYAWLRIRSIQDAALKTVYDFEVNHEDHSYCTIHGASHNSETGFSANTIEHSQGIMQSVSNAPGTEIILESTPNGIGNFFHQEWQKAEAGISDYIAIFVPWYWQDEYSVPAPLNFVLTPAEEDLKIQYNLSNDQIYWRRKKIIEFSVNGVDGEKSFRQEYSSNSAEAFILTGEDSFIDSGLVVSARNACCEPYGPLLVGVDPARFGDDRTSIIFRQGRVAYGLQTHSKKDTMEVAGIVHNIIQVKAPAKVFVDVGGLGAGVVDRLRELGHGNDRVVAVNAGSTPLDTNKYKNKRAEMWGLLKEWLMNAPVQIPDSNELHADLCAIKYKFDSNSRLQMEAKEDMKKRGIRSPDSADSLCLTFAYPQSALNANNNQSDVLNSLAGAFDERMKSINRSRQ